MAVKSLGTSATQSMLDDQKALMSIAPVNSQGALTALPAGGVPTYSASPGTAVTLDPTVDPTGLSCEVIGVKGSTGGTEVVTASFTNADGTVATGTATFTITQDPAELDVSSFNVTVATPVSQ
jgi:polyisoprenoid-binding protein YceI